MKIMNAQQHEVKKQILKVLILLPYTQPLAYEARTRPPRQVSLKGVEVCVQQSMTNH